MFLERHLSHRRRDEGFASLFADERGHFFRAAAFKGEDAETVEKGILLQKELQQFLVERFGDLDVRDVSDVGEQHQLRTGDGIGDVLREGAGEVLAVPFPCRRLRGPSP